MPNHPAHLRQPSVVAAENAWRDHRDSCPVCRDARSRDQACEYGRDLDKVAVLAAQDAYRETHPEAFAPEPHDG